MWEFAYIKKHQTTPHPPKKLAKYEFCVCVSPEMVFRQLNVSFPHIAGAGDTLVLLVCPSPTVWHAGLIAL